MYENGINFLTSYPRSGNSWFRYGIEFLSKQPTTGIHPKNLMTFSGLNFDRKQEYILIKTHLLSKTEYFNTYENAN